MSTLFGSPLGSPNFSPVVLLPLPVVGPAVSLDASGVTLFGIVFGAVSGGGAVGTLRGAACCCCGGFGCCSRGASGFPFCIGGTVTGIRNALICLGASLGKEPVWMLMATAAAPMNE